MADTKAANLRLESKAYSALHYLATIEGRSKADIVEDALNDYLVAHRDRLAPYAREVAALAGLTISGGGLEASRSRADVLRSRGRKGLVKA